MSVYRRPGSSLWWVNISHAGRRLRESTGTADRKEAQRIHDELKARLWKTTPKLRGYTWGKAVDLWCEHAPRSDSELLSLRKFGAGYEDRLLIKVTAESLEKRLKTFCRTDGTYTRYRTMLMAILHLAAKNGWLREVPQIPARKKARQATRDWITHEQWEKLYAALPAHMKPMAKFAIETGLRQANVLGLTWSRVDLERKLVWVEGEDAKGGKAISVPLSEGATEVLNGQARDGEFVFTYCGRPIKEIKTAFQRACCKAGIGTMEAGDGDGEVERDAGRYRGFTWHGLRHTWATWHVQNGTPLDVLQKLGGWSDMRMVQNYAHHAPGYLASFADNVRKK